MRLKESYFVNMPQYANKVMEFAMGVLNEKLKKRVLVSSISLYERFLKNYHYFLEIKDQSNFYYFPFVLLF